VKLLKSWEWERHPRSWSDTAAILAATGFGLGLSRVASGTFGTLPGVLILLAVPGLWHGPILWQALFALALCLFAVFLCDRAEKHFGTKDDGRIVADEYLTFPLCMIGLPLHTWVLAMAFVSHRVMDILKPYPARTLQRVPGGAGIVIDDVFSSLYSLALNHVLYDAILQRATG